MKRLAVCLLLAACVSNPIAAELNQLDGCWMDNARTAQMRWRVEPGSPGVHVGQFRGEAFKLIDGEGGFVFCRGESECQAAFLGAGRPTDDTVEWTQVAASSERLRIVQHKGAAIVPLFEGVRDGCD